MKPYGVSNQMHDILMIDIFIDVFLSENFRIMFQVLLDFIANGSCDCKWISI